MEKEKNHLFLLLKKSHKSSCSSEIRTHEQDVCALYKKLGIHYVTNTEQYHSEFHFLVGTGCSLKVFLRV